MAANELVEEEGFASRETDVLVSEERVIPSSRSINSWSSSLSASMPWTGGYSLRATSEVTRLSCRCSSSIACCWRRMDSYAFCFACSRMD